MASLKVLPIFEGESKRQVVVRSQDLPCEIVVDLDADGRLLGFELFDAADSLPHRLLDRL